MYNNQWQSDYYRLPVVTEPPVKQEKPRRPRFAKLAAALAAVMLVSAASGAGGAYLLMRNTDNPSAAAPIPLHEVPFISHIAQPQINEAAPTVYDDITEVVRQVASSVVEINTQSTQQNWFFGSQIARGAGSGVIISHDGYIITNAHVVEGAGDILVRMQDGTEHEAAIIGADVQSDLAVLKIEAAGLVAARFADSDAIEVGQLAIAIGNPLGELGGTVTSGIISAKGRELNIQGETMTLLQTSAAVNRGNSGGGLFDRHGGLVGVVNAKSAGTGIEGLAFAIPSNTAQKVANDLINLGFVSGRPQFGISIREISDVRAARAQGLPVTEPGVYVVSTQGANGLLEGDLLVSIGGRAITRTADLGEILRRSSVGDTLPVTVRRAGSELTIDVTLTERVPEEFRIEPEEA